MRDEEYMRKMRMNLSIYYRITVNFNMLMQETICNNSMNHPSFALFYPLSKNLQQMSYSLHARLIIQIGIIYQTIMFCILPCAAIKDTINLSPVGPSASIIPQMDKTRNQIRRLSSTDHLITLISQGEVIMMRKVAFDSYLKAHVDLMRSYVTTYTPCNFAYASFFTAGDITTLGLQPRDQWALQIVMTRLNISSIYQAGALNSMRVVFLQTANSYRPGFKATAELVKNIQITYQYFSEGYQPIQRLLPYFDAIESLASSDTRSRYLQLNRTMFQVYSYLLSINLAFLKIEKLRLLNEFKTCKEAAYAVYLRAVDCRMKLAQISSKFKVLSDISDFFELVQFFYQVMAFYFLLVQHEQQKHKEQLGFVKKQFQQMIYDNIAAVQQIERIMATSGKLNRQNDNVSFGLGVLAVVMQDVQRFKYRYSINVHENKMEKPKIQEVVARRIGTSTLWNNLDFF